MYTIEDFKNGKCLILHDGTLDELNKVLKYAYPNRVPSSGDFKYYISTGSDWMPVKPDELQGLPAQSVKLFLNQINKPMRKITWQQAQELIDEAYPNFRLTLARMWANDIVLKYDIDISEEFYNQLKVLFSRDEALMAFNRIFRTECPYKDGEPIWVCDYENSTWQLRYSNGKISIIGTFETYQYQRKNGQTDSWKYAMPFDPNNLPVNE